MCLGIPGRITQQWDDPASQLRMGKVDFDGITKDVCLAYVPTATVDDYVIVHVGFAINQIDAEEATHTLQLLREMGEMEALE